MPYIKKSLREEIDAGKTPETTGELTYVLYSQCMEYLTRFVASEPRFDDYAEAIAALECTKLELYRRAVAPYEEGKIAENGDL